MFSPFLPCFFGLCRCRAGTLGRFFLSGPFLLFCCLFCFMLFCCLFCCGPSFSILAASWRPCSFKVDAGWPTGLRDNALPAVGVNSDSGCLTTVLNGESGWPFLTHILSFVSHWLTYVSMTHIWLTYDSHITHIWLTSEAEWDWL